MRLRTNINMEVQRASHAGPSAASAFPPLSKADSSWVTAAASSQ
jgi:hypothetical protein